MVGRVVWVGMNAGEDPVIRRGVAGPVELGQACGTGYQDVASLVKGLGEGRPELYPLSGVTPGRLGRAEADSLVCG